MGRPLSYYKEERREIPLFTSVYAGFASPAEDHYEEQLNLNNLLMGATSSTFIHRAEDNSMFSSGILEGDILIINKLVKRPVGKIIVAKVGDEIHVKRLSMVNDELFLTSDSLKYPPIKLNKETDYTILGEISYSIGNLLSPYKYKAIPTDQNLHSFLVDNPVSTFFVRVSGQSMINAGIRHDDILIVDRSLPPSLDRIIIAYLDGGFTVKRLKKKVNFILFPENEDFPAIEITEEMDSRFWGVVTYCIHKVK